MSSVAVLGRSSCALLAALLLAGCGDDTKAEIVNPPPPGSGSAVLTDEARVLDDAALSALVSVVPDGDLFVLTFSATSPVLDELAAGNVLIAGTAEALPRGGLFHVESVTAEDGAVVVQARRAELAEAFRDLSIRLATTLEEPLTYSTLYSTASEGVVRSPLGISFPIALSAGDGEDRVALEGSLSFDSDVGVELDFDFESFELKELSLRFSAEETFQAVVSGRGQQQFDESVEIGSIGFATILITIPIPVFPYAVPVPLTPGIALSAGLRGAIRGDVQAGVTQRATFNAGLGFIDGEFDAVSDDSSTFEHEQPTYGAEAVVRAWAGPRLEVLVYDAVGPYASVEAFVEAAATVEGPPPCVTGLMDAGLTARVGVDFLADYSTVLFDSRYPLATFDSCTNDPNAPRPALTWAHTFGRAGSAGERVRAVIETADGSFVLVGDSDLFMGVDGFAGALWALRLDPLGNVVWQRAYGRGPQGMARDLVEVPGGILVAGATGVLKLDSGGNVRWAKAYTGEEPIEITSIAAHPDGSFVVAGAWGTETLAWLMKLDPAGEVVWSQSYGAMGFGRVRVTSDGGYVVVGTSSSADDVYVARLDGDGNAIWQRRLDNRFNGAPEDVEAMIESSSDRGFDIAEKPDGGFVVAAESYGNFPIPEPTAAGYYASWVVELDDQGEIVSSMVHRAPAEAVYGGAYAVGVRGNGNSMVLARRADTAGDLLKTEDLLLIQGTTFTNFGAAGNDAIFEGTLSGIGRGRPLFMTQDGGAVVAVTSDSFAGQEQFWVLKLDRTGYIDNPFRTSLSGHSYDTTEHALSSDLAGISLEAPVVAQRFTPEPDASDWTGVRQSP